MRFSRSSLLLAALAALLGLTLLPGRAQAWWNDDWSLRKSIMIDASASGAAINDPIGTTPILVRLHSGNFKFESAKGDGSDLRFIASDDHTPLKFHIEKYDSLLGEAFVWVSLPDLKPGAQTSFYLYYGNKNAPSADDPKGTYDPNTVLVYHFEEHGQPPHDSSSWANNATTAGLPDDGALIGVGLHLDGQTFATLPDSVSLRWADAAPVTWSAWINETALQPNATLFSRQDGANAFRIGVDNGAPFVELTGAGGTQRSASGAPITAAAWHHLAVATGAQITLYVDGSPYATLGSPLPALGGAALLGGDGATAAAPAPAAPAAAPAAPGAATGFVGDIDELDISKIARPAGFIRLAAIEQGPQPGKLITYGVDEETGSWLSGYFAVILRSVTLDGWVIIGILVVMAVISWFVMADKASYINRLSRADAQFLTSFRKVARDLTALDKGDESGLSTFGGRIGEADAQMIRYSSIYRIYRIGAEEIRHRFGADGQAVLDAESIAAIRASMDGGMVQETQRLNANMVLLTISIAGGPFIGLLGTVVGVMITFASIAASGDVNINAIAPGIAAALVATVAGLAVAIPALFGYNYLISRAQNSTDQMQVFADEFVTKMAEFYRRRPAPHPPAPLPIAAE